MHLQWVGHPIANDPHYGKRLTAPVADLADEVTVAAAAAAPSAESVFVDEEEGGDADMLYIPAAADAASSGKAAAAGDSELPAEYTAGLDDATIASLKAHCKYCVGLGNRGLFTDVQLRHEGIYLHALQYEVRQQS